MQAMECGNRLKIEEYSFSVITFIPGIRGIPDWVEYHHMGSEVAIVLPQDWCQDDHFLGLIVGCVYSVVDFGDESYSESGDMSDEKSDSSDSESEGDQESKEKSSLISVSCLVCCDGFQLPYLFTFSDSCECYKDAKEKVSDGTWVMYFPKVVISEAFHSNQSTYLSASFAVSDRFGKALKVKKSVIDHVYDNDRARANQRRDLVGNTFSDHGSCCPECQSDRVHEFKLCLEGSCDLSELPTIECPSVLETLCLRDCTNLESLPSEICQLKSLKGLFCSGCTKLKSFPDIMDDMENLRKLHLDETAIEELPSSIERLQGLQELRLDDCTKLVNLPESICNLRSLTTLSVEGCSLLNKLPENLGRLQSLQELYLDSISFQLPASLSGLCSLRILSLLEINLMQGAIPSDICRLNSLNVLILSYCNLIEGGIPSEIYCLSSLQALHLTGNHFSTIPAGINKLSELRVLHLSHCQKLLKIPELPSSLKSLDIHGCTSLETLSNTSSPLPSCLFKCFISAIQV